MPKTKTKTKNPFCRGASEEENCRGSWAGRPSPALSPPSGPDSCIPLFSIPSSPFSQFSALSRTFSAASIPLSVAQQWPKLAIPLVMHKSARDCPPSCTVYVHDDDTLHLTHYLVHRICCLDVIHFVSLWVLGIRPSPRLVAFNITMSPWI